MIANILILKHTNIQLNVIRNSSLVPSLSPDIAIKPPSKCVFGVAVINYLQTDLFKFTWLSQLQFFRICLKKC